MLTKPPLHLESKTEGKVPALVTQLGYADLIPFVAPAPAVWLVDAKISALVTVDRATYTRYLLRSWLPMRLTLTVVASVSCAGGAIGLLR